MTLWGFPGKRFGRARDRWNLGGLGGRSLATYKLDVLVGAVGISAITFTLFLYLRGLAWLGRTSHLEAANVMDVAAYAIALMGSLLVSQLFINAGKISDTLAHERQPHDGSPRRRFMWWCQFASPLASAERRAEDLCGSHAATCLSATS